MRAPQPLFAMVALVALGLSPAPSRAQEAPRESDPAAVLYRTAQLLEAEGELDLADSIMDFIVRRYPESTAAAAIRTGRAAPDGRHTGGDGRTELIVWSTLYGLWLGVALPGMLGADSPEPYGLVGGNLGAGMGVALARAYPISRSQARLASIAGVVGGLAGAGLDLIIQPESQKVFIAIPAVASAIGLGIGATRIDPGGSGSERRSEAGGADWSMGGPLFTRPVRGPHGNYRTAVSLTLLSGRF